MTTTIDIVLFDGVDELDAVGPLEVLRGAAARGADLSVRETMTPEQRAVMDPYTAGLPDDVARKHAAVGAGIDGNPLREIGTFRLRFAAAHHRDRQPEPPLLQQHRAVAPGPRRGHPPRMHRLLQAMEHLGAQAQRLSK